MLDAFSFYFGKYHFRNVKDFRYVVACSHSVEHALLVLGVSKNCSIPDNILKNNKNMNWPMGR